MSDKVQALQQLRPLQRSSKTFIKDVCLDLPVPTLQKIKTELRRVAFDKIERRESTQVEKSKEKGTTVKMDKDIYDKRRRWRRR